MTSALLTLLARLRHTGAVLLTKLQSVLTVTVAIAVAVAIGAGLLAYGRATEQQNDGSPADAPVVTKLEKLGARIQRDGNLPGAPVVALGIKDAAATDADLEGISALTQIRRLDLTAARQVRQLARISPHLL